MVQGSHPDLPQAGRRLDLTRYLNQERIVFLLTLLLFGVFVLALPNFLSTSNMLSLLRSVAVLGILGVGMLIVVLGRGIDLSMVAIMAISVAWALQLQATGTSLGLALALGLGFAVLMSLISGILIAYAEIPPLFATLAMGTVVYGYGRSQLITATDVVYMPQDIGWIKSLGQGYVLGIPAPVIVALIVSIAVWAFLRYTKPGRFIYAIGDNAAAARLSAIPLRPMLVMQYVISGAIAFLAGIITATSVAAMNTRVVNSNMIYDVILVVVLGGVGLSGGRGNVRNVLVGTLLIGVLMNGMTIMDIQYTVQNVIKSLILLLAIVVDSLLNPRDEQTGQQGDI
ncbi:ABC transporter permease [Bordetella hinzii]|uniref:Branched-chain amino acid ABC transporter, permease protein n=1 Tax=Bordetella hinzii OH87 BAL007II TaxID=1331262 RepID=A0ABR4QYR2_9BORD|nr:ABC transporter permease [Bordetella hinzii]AKQ53478.1 Ribose transport system permease protein RbsC [Bordetella hinzii]AKQ58039.1 Ribose transport system permease protein RbsC [Bordetella hinzii]KCB23093.1 branched-chain amino acid ABC transporter, permease protein [Bordetella hinzii OH87 BAL007II]KCB28829.1 branched-chain amino acid ABC transporter, permease protein [Bordetella hinzii CA90 BAL1384]KCB29536.1 branched-chain amino acid ABC transporter, permease protein [Bordetella hinzii L6